MAYVAPSTSIVQSRNRSVKREDYLRQPGDTLNKCQSSTGLEHRTYVYATSDPGPDEDIVKLEDNLRICKPGYYQNIVVRTLLSSFQSLPTCVTSTRARITVSLKILQLYLVRKLFSFTPRFLHASELLLFVT